MTDERKGLIELGWFGDMPPSDPIAASASPRPGGWLDGEIELTAFALAHPDCDVRAVLHGFAKWILAGSPPAWEPKAETSQFQGDGIDEITRLKDQIQALKTAMNEALTFHQTTHIHAVLRAALDQR